MPSRAANGRKRPWLPCTALLLGCLLACSGSARAATFEELYTVSVRSDPAARNLGADADAARRGMRILLTRITGMRQIADDPRLAGLIAAAPNHATGFFPVSADEIRVSFRRGPVNDALTQLGLPIWADERPSTLLWIAMDFGAGQRAEIGAATGPGARRSGPEAGAASNVLPATAEAAFESAKDLILGAADARGLPLSLPQLEGQDRQAVRFADVWGGFDEAVEPLAARYAADAILIGRLAAGESGWQVRWILRRGALREEFETADPAAGVERLADMFAAEYTIVGEPQEMRITIRGLKEWRDWQVLDYLEGLSLVDRVRVLSLSREGDLELSIMARGDALRLSQVLTLGGVLALPEAAAPLQSTPFERNALVFVPAWRQDELDAEAP